MAAQKAELQDQITKIQSFVLDMKLLPEHNKKLTEVQTSIDFFELRYAEQIQNEIGFLRDQVLLKIAPDIFNDQSISPKQLYHKAV